MNYKTADDLRRFGASLVANRPLAPFRLTIMNVCPEPADIEAAREILQSLPGKAVHHMFEDNVGYGAACNRGASLGNRYVLALFNADVELTPHAVDQCYVAMMAQPTWGVLGPRQVNSAGRLTHAGIFGTDDAPYINEWMSPDRGQASEARDAYSVMGSAYFIRRSVWDELTACDLYQEVAPGAEGAFLPTQLWYEETWCSVHTRAHGHQTVYYGPVCIRHESHAAIDAHTNNQWRKDVWEESEALFRRACDHHSLRHN